MARTPEDQVKANLAIATDQISEASKEFLQLLKNALDQRLQGQYKQVYKVTKLAYLEAENNTQNPPNWSKETMRQAADKLADQLAEQSSKLSNKNVAKAERVNQARSLIANTGIFGRAPSATEKKKAESAEQQKPTAPRIKGH